MTVEDLKIVLRPTTHRDAAFAWGLYHALMMPSVEDLVEWNEPLQRRLIDNDMASGDASIISIDGCPAGWILVRESGGHIAILQLYLKPSFQSRRVGTSIIHQLAKRARATGRELVLESTKNSARRLYERLGFVVTGESEYRLHFVWRGNENS